MAVTIYTVGQFTVGDALKLVGLVADVTEEIDDETGETLTHKGAKVLGVMEPVMSLIVQQETEGNVFEYGLHNVFLSSVRVIGNVTKV